MPPMTVLAVQDLMSREVVTLRADEDVEQAAQIMQLGRIRHLPVVEDGRLVGLISHRDVLVHDADTKIREAMSEDVQTVSPDTPALAAAELMQEQKYDSLPVVEGDRLVGIVTAADFLALAIKWLRDPGI